MATTKQQPLITKEDFCKIINELAESEKSFLALQDAMEKVSPGFYVDFFPHYPFVDKIVHLLQILMNDNPIDEYGVHARFSFIEYYIFDMSFGEDLKRGEHPVTIDGKDYSPTTPEELYDVLVELNFNTKKGATA